PPFFNFYLIYVFLIFNLCLILLFFLSRHLWSSETLKLLSFTSYIRASCINCPCYSIQLGSWST
ncbi:unnamed protein product, partial [Brassica rapa subsp. narinosa]